MMEFLATNWLSILVVFVFIIVSGNLWFKGYKKEVSLLILKMISIAENKYKHGENANKLNYVVNQVHKTLPTIVKFFITEKMLVDWIDKLVAETKDWLQNQTNQR